MAEGKGNLIRLKDLDDDFIIDLRYAGKENFTGQIVYQSKECWLDRNTAKLLIQAKNVFKRDGYRVKIWDAYRPISAQRKFWEIMPDDNFVARPPDMSRIKSFRPTHMNGLCIDMTLTDMSGNEIPMPSEFDDMTESAAVNYNLADKEEQKNAIYMKTVMEQNGFKGYDCEWWHFYDVTTDPTPFLDFQI